MSRSFYCIISAMLLVSASAFAADMPEDYSGTWSSNSGSGDGKLKLSIQRTADAWKCTLAYSIADQPEIQAQRFACSVDGSALTGHYEVDVEGGVARMAIRAVLTGDSLEGTYNEVGPDGKPADSGKWKASPAHRPM